MRKVFPKAPVHIDKAMSVSSNQKTIWKMFDAERKELTVDIL